MPSSRSANVPNVGRVLHRVERADVARRVRALIDAGESSAGSVPWLDRVRARLPLRADPGRRGAVALGVAALVASVVTCWWVFAARPRAMPVLAPSVSSPSASSASVSARPSPARSTAVSVTPGAAPPSAAGSIVVDVVGKVRRPGLYQLPMGSRVADAIAAAGGAIPGFDASAINLAAHIVDGQQVVVGVVPSAGAAGAAVPASNGTAGASGPVSLNNATLEQLQTLPGVGPVLAQHILDWRSAHGGFSSIGQLNDVPGIGDVKFASLKPLVTV